MPRRSSRKLAGCIAISLLLPAAAADFKAGVAAAGPAKALVIEDRRGSRAVFAEADFEINQAVADFVAVRLLQSYELPRPSLLLRRGAVLGPALPESLITAISAAMGSLDSAQLRYNGATLSATVAGRCLAAFARDAPLTFDHCAEGVLIRESIRAAFQMVEPTHGLLQRTDPVHAYPVQAIAFGKQVVVVALGGAASLPAEFAGKGLFFVSHANDSSTPPDDPRIRDAIRQVLSRVR